MINLTSSSIKGINQSKIAKNENNDCFVRALAAASDSSYDDTHQVVSKVFNRLPKKGTQNLDIITQMLLAEKNGLQIGNTTFKVNILGKSRLTNVYKLKGNIYNRKKTVKSFIQDNPTGSYVVTVSNHALCIKDGKLIDNKGEEFRPTRKVDRAYKIIKPEINKQLTLF